MGYIFFLIFILFSFVGYSQTLSSKSNEISLDFSDPKKNYSISIPTINWITPSDTVVYLRDGKFAINAEVKSLYGLNSVHLAIRDLKSKRQIKELSLLINEASKNFLVINQEVILPEGEFEVEITAENTKEFSSKVSRLAINNKLGEFKKKN